MPLYLGRAVTYPIGLYGASGSGATGQISMNPMPDFDRAASRPGASAFVARVMPSRAASACQN